MLGLLFLKTRGHNAGPVHCLENCAEDRQHHFDYLRDHQSLIYNLSSRSELVATMNVILTPK